MSQDPVPADIPKESDEDLRRVYGEGAIFTRSGPFLLVHLDSPSPELVESRTAGFDPDSLFVDDCPLCQASRAHGGHVVFAGADDDTSAGEEDSDEELTSPAFYGATPKAPAVELLRALDQLDVAADELVCALEPIASAELLKRTIEDVGFMHDRFVESMWAEESPARLEAFEQQFARATASLEEVGKAHGTLAPLIGRVSSSLDTIAGIWRDL